MYNFIKGQIVEITDSVIVIEANGVGYELNVSANAIREFSAKTGEVKIYCKLNVREDDMSLFGFASKQEKAMFDKLITVSGVGPKLALAVLSGQPTEALASAIVNANTALLSKIKGVGKKTAERIVLELKDKIDGEYALDNGVAKIDEQTSNGKANENAVMALMTLGFNKAEATAAVLSVQKEGMTLEQIIFLAMKNA